MKTQNGKIKISILEERMNNLINQNNINFKEILDKIKKIDEKLERNYVSKDRFSPIEKLVYAGVGAGLLWGLNSIFELIK